MKRKWIESYDVSIAQGLFAANASLDGLPGFLGAQFESSLLAGCASKCRFGRSY